MKTRHGFVSNSSSSSFIVVARKLGQDELIKHDSFYFQGGWLSEGQDFFEVKAGDKIYDYLLHVGIPEDAFCLLVADKSADEDEYPVHKLLKLKETVPHLEDFSIMQIEADYHTNADWSDFAERYERGGGR